MTTKTHHCVTTQSAGTPHADRTAGQSAVCCPHAGNGISPPLPKGQLIYVGLAAISRAVGAGPHTIKRWIREEAFPARRCSDGVYRANAQSMQDWFTPPYPGLADERTSRQWAVARGLAAGTTERNTLQAAGWERHTQ